MSPSPHPPDLSPSDPGADSAVAAWFYRPRVGTGVATVGAGALWSYVCSVFVYDETIMGLDVGAALAALALVAGVTGWFLALSHLLRRHPALTSRVVNVGLACGVGTTALVTADLSYGLYANWVIIRQSATMEVLDASQRRYDPRVWHAELYPPMYYPTDRNFRIYKPDVRVTGETYGGFYHPAMLESRRLTDSVLEARSLTYDIGPLGLRESASLVKSRTFALGDSFVFGYGTDEGEVWTDLLGQALDEPIYNLGVSATGPTQQLLLLEHLLEVHQDSISVERLLWMIYEGNDLENTYGDRGAPSSGASGVADVSSGTVLGAVLSIPGRIKNTSILYRALTDDLGSPPSGNAVRYDVYEVDGVRLPYPLYRSDRWGLRLFNFQEIELAGRPRKYVLEHPNRPKLEQTFQAMAALSRIHGFRVTVLIAPTAARLHGPSIEGFPPVSPEPHFIDFVANVAREAGFEVVDLLAGMQPYGDEQLLYQRDDHHWNRHGNGVAARVIGQALGG